MLDDLHKTGKTIVVITHETSAASYANRIITVADGLITSDVKSNHTHKHYEK